jgi:RNA polymerase sigma factor (sigma-70 family)
VVVLDPAGADDTDLVWALAHDAVAVEELYRRHVRPLTRYATRRLGDAEAAADLVAATFLAAIESAGNYDPQRGAPGAWLYGIASNLIASDRRRRASELRAVTRLGGQQIAPLDEFGRIDERMDARRRAGSVVDMLHALPTAERELVRLLVSRDLTVSEAAQTLGIRPATARMRLSRARGRLGVKTGEGL